MATMTYDDYVTEHREELKTAFKLYKLTGLYDSESKFLQQKYKEYLDDVIEHSVHAIEWPQS